MKIIALHKNVAISAISVVVALFAIGNSAKAVQFRGELRGVWEAGTDFDHTYGVSQVGIRPGDTFRWSYVYDAEDVNGLFSPGEHGLHIIKSDPLFPYAPGTILNFDAEPFAGGPAVTDGIVSGLEGPGGKFVWEYHFYNPETRQTEASHFSIGLNDFRGFGAGRLTWTDPVSTAVPETSTCVLLLSGLLPLWYLKRKNR